VIPTIAPFLLPRILPRLRREYPDLKLFLREETSGQACEQLHHGRTDCVLLALPFACGEVESAPLFDDRLYVAFPEGEMDPTPTIRPADIDANRLLMLEDGHCLKDHALAACNRPELRAEATMLGTSLHTMVQMVDNGLGVTMLPEMAVDAGILDHTKVTARPPRRRKCIAPHRPGLAQGEPTRARFPAVGEGTGGRRLTALTVRHDTPTPRPVAGGECRTRNTLVRTPAKTGAQWF